MDIIRKFKRLGWWEFVEYVDSHLRKKTNVESEKIEFYIEICDELKMRLLESISEGATFTIRKKVKELITLIERDLSQVGEQVDSSKVSELRRLILDLS